MINYIVWHLGPIWFGIACWEIGKAFVRKIRMPYRWKCKKCDFTVQTNNRETFEISKSSHNHITSREYK